MSSGSASCVRYFVSFIVCAADGFTEGVRGSGVLSAVPGGRDDHDGGVARALGELDPSDFDHNDFDPVDFERGAGGAVTRRESTRAPLARAFREVCGAWQVGRVSASVD
jgi:hypothetical protein